MTVSTRAAVMFAPQRPWEVVELELDDPGPQELRVRWQAAGLCRSDEHVRAGHPVHRVPMVGGHEGAGVVEAVGEHVTRVAVGDHVVASFVPVCGTCRWCSTGHQNLCDRGTAAPRGALQDGTYRLRYDGVDVAAMCGLGTFAERTVVSEFSVVRIDPDVPPDVAVLLSCAAPTGWGAAVHAAGVRAGQTVVVYGCGGIGSNAVQGAAYAGATNVVVVDPEPFKVEMAKALGATHTFTDAAQAAACVRELTGGELAEHALVTVDVATSQVLDEALAVVGKTGTVTLTSHGAGRDLWIGAGALVGRGRTVRGTSYGDCNPLVDIPRLLSLYRADELKLEELVTHCYRLDDLGVGYADLAAGRNIRGVVLHGGDR